MLKQVSMEDLSSVRVAADLIAESLKRMSYTHRHKATMGGCEECQHILNLCSALAKIDALLNKTE